MNLRSTILIVFTLLVLLTVTACKDKDKPTIPGVDQFGILTGIVYSDAKVGLADATVSVGNKSTTTDQYGNFILSGLSPAANALVNFAKVGYIGNQKTAKIEAGKTTFVHNAMLTAGISTNFSSDTETVIQENWMSEVAIPANAFKKPDGSAFTGVVRAEVRYFDPTQESSLDAFPGTFMGTQTNGTEVMFESYGFISANFYDANDPATNLQLAEGKTAEIKGYIPWSLQANAPATIPMWYYDDTTGKWMEEGVATKVGDYYVGEVGHFSYWNFDHPIVVDDQSTLTGKVKYSDNTPVVGAQVVAQGVNYAGYTRVYSDAQGNYSISVKASAQAKVRAFSGSLYSNYSAVITTPAGGGSLSVSDLIITEQNFTIMGRLVDSSNAPIANASGQCFQVNPPADIMEFSAWINTDADGYFSVVTSNPDNQTNITVQFRTNQYRSDVLYSNSMPLTMPQPGQIKDFGNVTMRPGGKLTGRLKTNTGTWIANGWVNFMKDGATGEGSMLHAETDENGNFTVIGPPGTRLTNMRASVWQEGNGYRSELMTMNFPASNATSNMGTITVSPYNP